MNIEKLEEFIKGRTAELIEEVKDVHEEFVEHIIGHLTILEVVQKMIKEGYDYQKTRALVQFLKNEATLITEKVDEEYMSLLPEERHEYNFGAEYFKADGRACQCMELEQLFTETERKD